MKHLFNKGVRHILGDGKSISFWEDVWIDSCPLKIRFDKLFRICEDPKIIVANCWFNNVWNIQFTRSFGREEIIQWEDLKNLLFNVEFRERSDSFHWCLHSSGLFSVKTLYIHVSFGGVTSWKLQRLWRIKIPLKIKIFLWQVFQDRVQTAKQLSLGGWKGDINCVLCGVIEDSYHVIFLLCFGKICLVLYQRSFSLG